MDFPNLAVKPPVSPMLAKLSRDLPEGDYIYEPKWDGFRCVLFRDGDEVELGSRNELPLTRYFPDVVDAARRLLPDQVVLDGEIVVAGAAGLDFDVLSQRVHPAESRVRLLAEATPASFVAFDLLCTGTTDLRGEPFSLRRARLEELLGAAGAVPAPAVPGADVHLTPATRERAVAADWFERFEGAGLDGVVAKATGLRYLEGKRAMVKVKHERTAEFVVAGFRPYRPATAGTNTAAQSLAGPGSPGVGSLLLGLYDKAGSLSHVGVIGAFPAQQRRELAELLEPYRVDGPGLAGHPWGAWAAAQGEPGGQATDSARLPGARSRWNAKKDLSFFALRPELVVEASYEHLQGHRLRHTGHFRRWRPDRDPRSCTYEQLDVAVPVELAEVFAARA
ncbi:MAG TPA: ATP-dependent DNA ligase [Acidimicrobiales bacterium]|nr:ATP-dependent DNA ligase [Acidimicrobiales bacterium]